MTTENNTDGKNSIDCDKFKPLIDYYGDIKPSCGDLFTLCMTTDNKDLFYPALLSFLCLFNKIKSIDESDKKK